MQWAIELLPHARMTRGSALWVSVVCRLLELAGYGSSTVDEYFYQDEWQGPSKLSDRILLFLGDPLEQVDVPFTPTTLILNLQLA